MSLNICNPLLFFHVRADAEEPRLAMREVLADLTVATGWSFFVSKI